MSAIDELFWFKSSYSGSEGDSCVEVTLRPDAVYVRDSKESDGPQLTAVPAAWADFIGYVTL
ncbi:DUF397 domain-containing protein [Streptomyces sp. NPDC059499]|uniref:DUF397 domain-containing protein n=1 Tax=Streptomyces sp. NPDC059499 TaxID=3346852 RepID=UPI0036797439